MCKMPVGALFSLACQLSTSGKNSSTSSSKRSLSSCTAAALARCFLPRTEMMIARIIMTMS
ncbi:hypothetical protein TYRP_001842 [Tyrophagus putrescentiae]|nr:hypothetical protein TYRP_001842 [Tyrophagus putrescentiae]